MKERKIQFRGKRINRNDEWAYGDLRHFNGDVFIFPQDEEAAIDRDLVDESTIGQYTGLKDKNGKEIYEGDIITVNRNKKTKGFLYVVIWERHGWLARPILKDATPSLSLQFYNEFDEKKIEVVGNIYDNKELLSEK